MLIITVLAVLFLLSKPIFALLIPYSLYSLFHVLSYVRTNVLPALSPNSPLGTRIADIVNKSYDPAMSAVAGIELLVIFPRLLVGVIFRRNSFMLFLAYVGFLRVRWEQNKFVRQTVGGLTARIDGLVADQNVPSFVKNGWNKLKQVMSQYAGQQTTVTPQPPSPAAKKAE